MGKKEPNFLGDAWRDDIQRMSSPTVLDIIVRKLTTTVDGASGPKTSLLIYSRTRFSDFFYFCN